MSYRRAGVSVAGGPSQPPVSATCLDRITAVEAERSTACPAPMGAGPTWHAQVGTEIGNMIETSRWADGKTRLRQLKVPFASKSECNDPPDQRTSPGFLDLVEIVRRDEAAKEVVLRYAEVKPMTRSGLTDGARDLQCYGQRITEAGAKCPSITLDGPPALEEYVDFCGALDAYGWLVRLDDEPLLFRQPALEEHVPHTFMTAPGGDVQLTIMTCQPGLVTYQCEGAAP